MSLANNNSEERTRLQQTPYEDADHQEDPNNNDDSNDIHPGLQRLILVAAATAATLGYDVGIMAAAIQPLEEAFQLTGVQKELAMGSLNFTAALGALLGGKVANDRGRKPTVQVCCWIFVGGTFLMATAPNYAFLLLGRIVTGIGVGVSFVVAPVYLSEVAPTDSRGKLNTVFDVAINAGILLGYVLGFVVQLLPFLGTSKWRLMLGLGVLLPLLVLYNLSHLPESPRWLVLMGQSEAARHILQHTLGYSSNEQQVDRMIASIEEEVAQEQQQPPKTSTISSGMQLAMALGFWQQITGTEAVLYYSADFLKHAGLESPTQRLAGNVFVGLCKLTPELVAMQYVDTVGRRPLLLASAVALVVSTFCLSAAFFYEWSPLVVVIFLCAIMASFSTGLGPFTFLVASESLNLTERATGMTYAAALNRCTSGMVALTAVSLDQALGTAGLFALYGSVGLLSLPFYYKAVPETTGQSLEELAARRNRNNNTATANHPEQINVELNGSALT